MKNTHDFSDADLQATDELFAQDISSEVLTISAATDLTDRSPEQRIITQSMLDLRNTFSRQPKRMQRTDAAQLGRPEFLEVRSLLSSDPLDAYGEREKAAQTLDETNSAVQSAQQDLDAVQTTLADLQDLLTKETATLTDLHVALKASNDLALQSQADLVNALGSVRTRTLEQSTARADLPSAQKSLNSAVVALKTWQKNLEKALGSSRLVERLQADITSARQRVESATKNEADAADRLRENPSDVALQQAFLAAQKNHVLAKATEGRKILILESQLGLAAVQMEKDHPVVHTARKNTADAEVMVEKCIDTRNGKLASSDAASKARTAAIADVTRVQKILVQARADIVSGKTAVSQSQSRMRALQGNISNTEPHLKSATAVLAQAKSSYRHALEHFRKIQDHIDDSEVQVLLRQIDEINEEIALLEKELVLATGIPIHWPTKPSGFSKEVVGVMDTPGIPDATAISADGTILLTSSRANAGPLVVRNMETGEATKNLSYGASVKSGAISADGRFAAATYGDRRVLVWDIEKGSILQNITTGDYSNTITFLPGTTLVAFQSDAGATIRTLDYVTGALTELQVPSWGTVSASGTLPSGDNIIAGSDDKIVTFASRTDNTVLKKIATSGYAKAIEFSSDAKYVAIGNANNQITIIDTSTWNTVASLNGSAAGVDGYLWDLKFLQGGSTLAIIGWNGKVSGVNFSDLLSGKVTTTFSDSLGGAVTSAATSADGSGMVVGVYETKKVYAFSFPSSGKEIADEIAAVRSELEKLQEDPAYILHAAKINLSRIDALTQPWSTEGQENRMQLLTERGTVLQQTSEELTKLGTETQKTLGTATGYAKMSLESLSERIQATALNVGGAMSKWTKEQSLFDTHPWQLLSEVTREGLFTNNAPKRPMLSVVNLSGPNVTLFFSGSTEGRTVRLNDMGSPGDLGSKTVIATHDDEQQTATVTINAQNPSGTYAVQLLDAQMRIIGSLPLHWNQDTKVLSLTDASHAFTPAASIHDEGFLSYEELFTQAKSEEDAQIVVAGPAAAKEQLFSGVASAIPVGFVPDFNMNYSKIFKEQAQLQLLDLAARSGVNFILTSEQMRYAFLEFNPEYKRTGNGGFEADKGVFLGQFVQKFNGYYQMAARLLQKTMDVVLAARQGKNTDTLEYWRGLHAYFERDYYGQQIAAAKMVGVPVADVSAMLSAVQAIYDNQFDAFLAFQDATYTAMINKQNEFKNWQPAVSKEGSSNSRDGMNSHESERMLRAQVKARDAAIARGVAGDSLQMYNRGIMLAENNHQKVLAGTTVYAYGVPESTAKHNFEIVLESEGLGTPEERAAAYLKANPEARQYLAGLEGVQQEDIAMRYLAAYPDDNTIIDSLSVGMQDKVKSTLARAKSPTVVMEREMDIAWREVVVMTDNIVLHAAANNIEPISTKNESREVTVKPGGKHLYAFSIAVPTMVNISMSASEKDAQGPWIDPPRANFSLQLRKADGTSIQYSGRDAESGDTISVRLDAGTYELITSDSTSYPSIAGMTSKELKTIGLPTARYQFEARPYNSAQIMGRISIDGNPQTMPVSMRVAEFFDDGERKKTKDVRGLDINKPVWVVIHGMGNSEDSIAIKELTKALYGLSEKEHIQVVTVDWKDAAKDGVFIQDANWAKAVGDWAAEQLIKLGFPPSYINAGVHSHGTYGGFFMSKRIHEMTGQQMNTLVAMDSAMNIPPVSGQSFGQIDFRQYTKNSLAIDSSIVAGSDALAAKADVTLKVNTGSLNTFANHQAGMNVLTSIFNREKSSSGSFSQFLSLKQIMSSAESNKVLYAENAYTGIFEGVIDVGLESQRIGGETYYKTTPFLLRRINPLDDREELIQFDYNA